jgi:hypothetical protein
LAQIFKKSANLWPFYFVAIVLIAGAGVTGFFWYFGSPEYTDVGYRPTQPVEYSHKLHAGDLGIDCRYCHTGVEVAANANVPATETCMNCHSLVGLDNAKVEPVRQSWTTNKSIEWVRVHDLPDYAFFNHSAHINVGVGCESCHGNVAAMDKVTQVKSLSMGWCLSCHRDPEQHIRPLNEITKMEWKPFEDHSDFAKKVIKDKNITPPTDCSGCHR